MLDSLPSGDTNATTTNQGASGKPAGGGDPWAFSSDELKYRAYPAATRQDHLHPFWPKMDHKNDANSSTNDESDGGNHSQLTEEILVASTASASALDNSSGGSEKDAADGGMSSNGNLRDTQDECSF